MSSLMHPEQKAWLLRQPEQPTWLNHIISWTQLAPTNLAGEALGATPSGWNDHDIARRRDQEDWCGRREIALTTCDLIATDTGAAAIAWCAQDPRQEQGCADRFAALVARFEEEWRIDRAAYLAGLSVPDLTARDLRRAYLTGTFLAGADLSFARMKGAHLFTARLEGANLRGAGLEAANLFRARLEGAYLFEARLERANLFGARLEGADLGRAGMAGADLSEARLEGANLRGAELEAANLRSARMAGADLGGAKMEGANVRRAGLESADLREAQMAGADLRGADFRSATWAGAETGGPPIPPIFAAAGFSRKTNSIR